MTTFITFDDLRHLNGRIDKQMVLNAAAGRRKSGSTVFLSHSSQDAEYLPAVVKILEAHGASVYVDLDDNRLPDTPSSETADILRSTISTCGRLVMFVTPNSKDSKWVPWELGIADGQKGNRRVALFPAAENQWDQSWAGQEYLGLYSRIVWGNFRGRDEQEWMVLDHHNNSADPLRDWLGTDVYSRTSSWSSW